jgi:hypothetical protein
MSTIACNQPFFPIMEFTTISLIAIKFYSICFGKLKSQLFWIFNDLDDCLDKPFHISSQSDDIASIS